MLSDEEKKGYEEAKLYLTHTGVDDFNLEKHQSENRIWAIQTILNLIDKQSKEIEELKEIKSKLDEKNIPIETLLAEFERLEDLEDDLTTVYLNGVYDGEKKVKDKIKAKIEEYRKEIDKLYKKKNWYEPWDTEKKNKYMHYIEFGQSLLEKE